jgi:hypothetical protein
MKVRIACILFGLLAGGASVAHAKGGESSSSPARAAVRAAMVVLFQGQPSTRGLPKRDVKAAMHVVLGNSSRAPTIDEQVRIVRLAEHLSFRRSPAFKGMMRDRRSGD